MYICMVLILICPKRLKRVKPLLKPELPRVFQWQLLGSECWSDKVGEVLAHGRAAYLKVISKVTRKYKVWGVF